MQFNSKDYDPEKHDRYKALTVKQPYATDLVTAIREDESGTRYGLKSIEVRSKPTKYRGDILICSSAKPEIIGLDSGTTLGFVELYGIKPVSEFTPEDWKNTRIPKDVRAKIKSGWGWLVRNPRRVIEFPVTGQLGIFNLVFTKDTIIKYPEVMQLDKKGYDIATGKTTKKNEKDWF